MSVYHGQRLLKENRQSLDDDEQVGRPTTFENLRKTKICAKFVSHILTEEQKLMRVHHPREIVRAANNSPNFLKSIITGDETWYFQYDPKTKH